MNDKQLAPVDDGGSRLAQADPTEVGALSAMARVEVEIKAAITVAKRYPRDVDTCFARAMKECDRAGFAKAGMYSFPRGGTNVKGPSVDLARGLARIWGNMRYGLDIVSEDEDRVHVRGWAYDVETNIQVSSEDKFPKMIQRKGQNGQAQWIRCKDEREIRELVNRRGAICVRNALLQVIPADLIDSAQERCEKTLRKAAAGEIQESREETIRSLVLAFSEFGVTKDLLEGRLGHPLQVITADELVELRKSWKTLSDGHTTVGELFDLAPVARHPARQAREKGEVNVEDVVAPAAPPEEARASLASSLQPKQTEIDVDGEVICEACKKPGPLNVYTVARDGRAVCPVCEDKGYKLVPRKPGKQ